MKRFCSFISTFAILLTVSCDDQPGDPVSVVPEIKYGSLQYWEGDSPTDADSLKLTIDFRDGDMDLGLSPTETDAPYHPVNYFLRDNAGKLSSLATRSTPFGMPGLLMVEPGQTGKLVNYYTRGQDLPEFQCPFRSTAYTFDSLYVEESDLSAIDEQNYNIVKEIDSNPDLYILLDTFYYERNPNHYNIDVQFFIRDNGGTYIEFDWRKEFCVALDFDSRFPRVDHAQPLTVIRNGAFELKIGRQGGTLSYSMTSFGFSPTFAGKSFKLKITIRDRALHSSNTIETPTFTLDQIRQN